MNNCDCKSTKKTPNDNKWIKKDDNITEYIEKLTSPFIQKDIIQSIIDSRDNFVNSESTINDYYIKNKDTISLSHFKSKLDSLL